MLQNFILVISSSFISCFLTTVVNEWRFKLRQKEALIKEIVNSFLKLRKEGNNDQVYELRNLQYSSILLLKKEKDAEDVLKRIELIDKPVNIPSYIKDKGILQGLKEAIKKGIDICDFRENEIQEIEHKIENHCAK